MVRKVHCYADGGKVIKDHDTTTVVRPDRPAVRGSSSSSTSDAIRNTVKSTAESTSIGDTLVNKRKKQMEDLGLKDGGSVSKFDKLKGKLAKESGVTNPGGLAASIGRKKFGAAGMAAKAAAGRKKG